MCCVIVEADDAISAAFHRTAREDPDAALRAAAGEVLAAMPSLNEGCSDSLCKSAESDEDALVRLNAAKARDSEVRSILRKTCASGRRFFLVNNAELGSQNPGLELRRLPTPQSECTGFVVPYGSVISGEPVFGEWLKVGKFYFPFKVNQRNVLKEIRPLEWEALATAAFQLDCTDPIRLQFQWHWAMPQARNAHV